MPQIQLSDGDVIFVGPRESTIKVSGLAENAKRFEFSGGQMPMSELIALAKPLALATHARVIRNNGVIRNVEYYPLSQAANVILQDGDEMEFTADKRLGSITDRVERPEEKTYALPTLKR